jgi:DNA-binding MarR family transcriptional regulator
MSIKSTEVMFLESNGTMPRIYSEIQQSKVFALPERELAVTLLRTGDALHHSVDRAVSPSGISHEQYNALRILRGAGEAGHPTLDISRRMVSRSPNITRLLDKLIDKGLARRDRGKEDRRQALVKITPQGLDLLVECDKAVHAVVHKLSCLSKSETKLLVDLLDRVREAVVVTTAQEELLRAKDPKAAPPSSS